MRIKVGSPSYIKLSIWPMAYPSNTESLDVESRRKIQKARCTKLKSVTVFRPILQSCHTLIHGLLMT